MIGLSSSGGGATEDPVTATFRVLADPVVYQAKYAELLKQTSTAQEAAEAARKEHAAADVVIAKAGVDMADVAKARAECERANDALARREMAVVVREQNCVKLQAVLNEREASIMQAAKVTKDQLDAARAALESDVAALNVHAAAIAARQDEIKQLNAEAVALKIDYERRIEALLAIAGGGR